VILGMAQSLRKDTVPPESREEVLDTLIDRARALGRLVQRFEAAVEAGLTEWADVNEVAREVGEFDPRVRVEADDAPLMATLNRTAARRILEELVENALSLSPADADVTVRVTTGPMGPEVRIVDHGPGIDPASEPRIFEALAQGEDLHTRTHQGVGLGLTLAKMSARAMDGDVVLESTGPEGSTFLWTVSGRPT
jgi:signal transduction histidine kinase